MDRVNTTKSSQSSGSRHTDTAFDVVETQDHHAVMPEGKMMNNTQAAEEQVGPMLSKEAGAEAPRPKLEKFAYGCEFISHARWQ